MRTGAAISVTAHVAVLTAWLLLAGVRPFEPTTAEAITIDIVTPEEAPPLPKEADYSFPTLDEKSQEKSQENPQEKSQEQAAQKQQEAAPQPTEPAAPAPNAASKPKQDTKQAALRQQPPEQAQPAPQQPPQPQQQAQPQTPPPQQEVPTAAPDITSKFGMMFTLPDVGASGDFDAKAMAKSNISREDVAALRAHLKTCSVLPRSVSSTDNVSVVLRVAFRKDGTLAAEPLLIEASASAKGPALMRGAMDALTKCQPYAMLPPDRYDEWRMLDLSFSPKDFRGG